MQPGSLSESATVRLSPKLASQLCSCRGLLDATGGGLGLRGLGGWGLGFRDYGLEGLGLGAYSSGFLGP